MSLLDILVYSLTELLSLELHCILDLSSSLWWQCGIVMRVESVSGGVVSFPVIHAHHGTMAQT